MKSGQAFQQSTSAVQPLKQRHLPQHTGLVALFASFAPEVTAIGVVQFGLPQLLKLLR